MKATARNGKRTVARRKKRLRRFFLHGRGQGVSISLPLNAAVGGDGDGGGVNMKRATMKKERLLENTNQSYDGWMSGRYNLNYSVTPSDTRRLRGKIVIHAFTS